jgi:hypothetical protein
MSVGTEVPRGQPLLLDDWPPELEQRLVQKRFVQKKG